MVNRAKLRFALFAAALLAPACGGPSTPSPPAQALSQHAPPPLIVGRQPKGIKRCDAPPSDYPGEAGLSAPPRVPFASLPKDPELIAKGVSLITFRSAELVFHISPEVAPAVVDCTVAAADDAVAFVNSALALPSFDDGGPTREVFLLSPETAEETLERLDPGRRLGAGKDTGRVFVAAPDRSRSRIIVQWKALPLSYLDIGFAYAHEWTHVIQGYARGAAPKEMDVVVEGEANLLAALFHDFVLPGAGTLFWDRDTKRLMRSRAERPGLSTQDLLHQRPHEHHDELSLFGYMARAVPPPMLGKVRLVEKSERLDYASAWRRVVGRDLVDNGIEQVIASPDLAPRPTLSTDGPTLSVARSEGVLWFAGAGFKPGEQLSRVVRAPNGHADTTSLRADNRGAVAWTWKLRPGPRYRSRLIEVRGDSAAVRVEYWDGE